MRYKEDYDWKFFESRWKESIFFLKIYEIN